MMHGGKCILNPVLMTYYEELVTVRGGTSIGNARMVVHSRSSVLFA